MYFYPGGTFVYFSISLRHSPQSNRWELEYKDQISYTTNTAVNSNLKAQLRTGSPHCPTQIRQCPTPHLKGFASLVDSVYCDLPTRIQTSKLTLPVFHLKECFQNCFQLTKVLNIKDNDTIYFHNLSPYRHHPKDTLGSLSPQLTPNMHEYINQIRQSTQNDTTGMVDRQLLT